MHDSMNLSGQIIASQFQVERMLGEGGMGAVYLADQIDMGRKVVIKVLHPELTAGSPKAVERFKREARAVAQLNHPNIVQVFVFGETDQRQMYIAMEYVDGDDLALHLKSGEPMHQARALKIADQVCSALIEAHSAGIVHRDMKPDNIMLTNRHGNPDYVKVLDFGIAKLTEPGQAQITQAGSVFGTPRYMAPEQTKSEPVDARTDIYAMGVILYEMMSGEHPFTATTALDYMVQHATVPAPPPSEKVAGLALQPRVEQLVLRCLEKSPDARFASARELQREIRLALRDFPEASRGFPTPGMPSPTLPPEVVRPTVTTKHVRPKKQGGGSKLPWIMTGGLLVVVGAAVAVLIATSKDDPTGDAAATKTSAATSGASNATDLPSTTNPAGGTTITASGKPPSGTNAAGTNAAGTNAADAAVIARGKDLDGFPLPQGLKKFLSSEQSEIYELVKVSPAQVIAFYRHHLKDRHPLEDIANGLRVGGKAVFNQVLVHNMGGDNQLILNRNLLVEQPTRHVEAGRTFFTVPVPGDVKVVAEMDNVVTLRTRMPKSALFGFYAKRYKGKPNVMFYEMDEPPILTVMNQGKQTKELGFTNLSVMGDPIGKAGGMMISIQR